MYSSKTGLILGFHGCDEGVAHDVITGRASLKHSRNSYDWLGNGIYFWEDNPKRALEFAEEIKSNPRKSDIIINNPTVLGAVIDLGICLDLMNTAYLRLLKIEHANLEISYQLLNEHLPVNKKLLRNLDCLVIERLCKNAKQKFDSVRGVFVEGDEVYSTAGFHDKTHIQICIRNPNCIKGYFLPRNLDNKYKSV